MAGLLDTERGRDVALGGLGSSAAVASRLESVLCLETDAKLAILRPKRALAFNYPPWSTSRTPSTASA